MLFSPFSLLMAVLWSSMFILLIHICRKLSFRHHSFIEMTGLFPITLLVAGTILRCFAAIEIPGFTKVIPSWNILTTVKSWLLYQIVGVPIYRLLLILWIAVALILIISFALSSIRYFKKMNSYITEDDETILDIAARVSRDVNTTIPKVVMMSGSLTPVISGLIKPVIFIPEGKYSNEELIHVFRHELLHWKNKDRWIKLFIQYFCCIFWWNPLVHLLKSNLDEILELRCDAAVSAVYSESECKEYAKVLLKTLSIKDDAQASSWIESSLSDNERILLGRIHLIINTPRLKRNQRITSVIATFCISLLLLFSYSFVFQTAYTTPAEEIELDGYVEMTPDNTYILLDSSGEYWIYFFDEQYSQIDKQVAEMMIEQSGFELKYDGSSEQYSKFQK